MDDEFSQHRIEGGCNHLPLDMPVSTRTRGPASGSAISTIPAGRRHKTEHRTFGVNAILDRVAVDPQSRLPEAKGLARGNMELLGHEIDGGDHLRHRVLDWQTRIHFQEKDLAAAIDEFDRAGIAWRCRPMSQIRLRSFSSKAGDGASSTIF